MSDSESSDDLPLAKRTITVPRMPTPSAEENAEDSDSSDSEADVPLANRKVSQPSKRTRKPEGATTDVDSNDVDAGDDEDSEDDSTAGKKRKRAAGAKANANGHAKRPRKSERTSTRATPSKAKSAKKDDKSVKWNTLEHGGVLFPPEYTPHGVKLKYDGVPVDLTTEQEEVATMFAAMLETDYVTQKKEQFMKNFWADFKHVLGPKHVIKGLNKCDFRDIYNHLMEEREAKKNLSKEEKQKLKEEKEAAEAKYKYALVDGNQEPVGNFRVEPPGLFRGRGEHPKMGKLKCRIYPSDITINIGKGVDVPTHPYPDQEWKEVRHDNTVTWLAYWKDPIDPRGYKYVWLGANSTFKTEADLEKYEKARKLKEHIQRIRADYRRLWKSKDVVERQKSTALYFIDVLALRAGHEKDEDEADTVGCCTLKAENVEMLEDDKIKFDFLGKDSIRYENIVDVDPEVWRNMKAFKARDQYDKKKKGEDQLFDAMCAQDLNVMMKDYMDGLSVKVFRTYNASVTLNRLLFEDTESEDVVSHKADYDRANKEVAILCNHQRAVPKTHEKSMQAMDEKIEKAEENLNSLKKDLKLAKSGKSTQDGKNKSVDVLEKQVAKAQESLNKLKVTKNSKEELKTVALGTSKINYLDPRITVAWCKRKDVPLEKIFNKSLLGKFTWAMEVEPEFAF